MQYPWLTATYDSIAKAMDSQKAHHALLFIGHQSLGTQVLMEALAKRLLCHNHGARPCGQCKSCQLFEAGNHPDLHVIESDKQIGVDSIRSGIKGVQDRSHLLHSKVLLIKQADTMTESAANALLKTMEEPTEDTYLLLDSPSLHALLPTITSRCQHNVINAPSVSMLSQWLMQQGTQVPEPIVERYLHQPLTLIDCDDSNDITAAYEQLQNDLSALELTSIPVLAARISGDIEQQLPWLKAWLVEQSKRDHGNNEGWLTIYQELMEKASAIRHAGTNKSLLLTQVLHKIATNRQ